MKVIMLQNIEKVGNQGDVVNVKRGFARNYLTPRGLAIYATPANMKKLGMIQGKMQEQEQKLLAELKNLAEKIAAIKLVFARKVDENGSMFGSVSENDIVHALHEKGITLHKSTLVMDKHFKELGEIAILVRLHKEVSCSLNIVIEQEQE
ncbi:MAG: 50S ribosomal protein L9 [Candidatus Cloacimonas sp.]|jgi:large subunit ribosomal protein L9|nr:50S ribosomal protein L9 [Candidatus Cloacimonas sp.]